MRGTQCSRLALHALAIVSMGLWVGGCSNSGSSKTVLAPHGVQTAPAGDYSVAWSGVDVRGSGRIVIPGQPDVLLGPDQVKDLAHALLNVAPVGHHGLEVTSGADENGVAWLAIDPHPHGAAKVRLAYDPETGRAEGSLVPATFPAPSAALDGVMKEFIVRSTGIQQPQDVTATKFEIASESYSLHWTPDAKRLEPGDVAYPALLVSGLTIEGVFYVGETASSFSATIDQLAADVNGAQVGECPECATAALKPGHRPFPMNP